MVGGWVGEVGGSAGEGLGGEVVREGWWGGVGRGGDERDGLRRWEQAHVASERLTPWVNNDVTKKWGKKAACRVYHICTSGHDIKLADPFATGEATDKPVKRLADVPGANAPISTLYDASQALSWVATPRNNPAERLNWQRRLPELFDMLHPPP